MDRRVQLGCAAALLGLAHAAPAAGEPIAVETIPVRLNAANLVQDTVGRLRFRGGLVLTSEDGRLGGLSALGISDDGARLVALSDHGRRFRARLVYGADGRLVGLAETKLAPLAGLDGAPLTGKRNSDAEALAPTADGGIVVAFERRHRLWRYRPGRAVPEPLAAPRELADAPRNGGIEALARLADGRLLALAEDLDRGDAKMAWLGGADGWSALTYVAADGFKPTGAASLPGGDVVVIERRLNRLGFFVVRLALVDKAHIAPGARITTSLLAALDQPLAVDNFEGIAARRGEHGETLIYLISDDNFRDAQRTLLMMFELIE